MHLQALAPVAATRSSKPVSIREVAVKHRFISVPLPDVKSKTRSITFTPLNKLDIKFS
jgi:hypothetical protein